jgi:outer membrane protein assembly factor BamB
LIYYWIILGLIFERRIYIYVVCSQITFKYILLYYEIIAGGSKMLNKVFKKKIIIGIIFLLFGATVIPTINASIFKKTETNNIISTPILDSTSKNDNYWWPMFRCDSGNCGYSSSIGPVRDQISWKTNVGDYIYSSSPVIVDDKVFISSGWMFDALNPPITNITDIFYGPTIFEVIEDLTTYNVDYEGAIYCLDSDTGEYLWEYPLYAPNDPAVFNGRVYVTDLGISSYTSTLYCLDAETGALIWEKPIGQIATSPTIIKNNKIYISTLGIDIYEGAMLCLDLNGDILWTYSLPPYEIVWFTAPAVDQGLIFFRTTNLYYYYYEPGYLYCLNADTGQFKWLKELSSFWFYFGTCSPVASNGKVFLSDVDWFTYTGLLKCFDGKTGDIDWAKNLGFSLGTPAVCDGFIYASGLDLNQYECNLYKLDENSGSIIWKTSMDMYSLFALFTSPTCSKDHIFYGGGEFFYYTKDLICLDKDNGNVIWIHTLDEESIVTPSIADERVYIADFEGNVYAFEDKLEIGKISGSFLGVKTEFKNIAESNITGVEYLIMVRGGILNRINKSFTGTINFIDSGKSKIIRNYQIFGFGEIDIEVRTTMPGLDDILIKKAKGFVLGTIVIVR